jgi:hypothetical protein
MEEKEIKKGFEALDREAVSHKMAALMLMMVKSNGGDDQFELFAHVMENFSKEEMAFIVTIHSAKSIEEAISQMPELNGMIGAINMLQAMEDKIDEDDQRGSKETV